MKKQCFVGLGGAGKNSIKPFIEKEKNAEFVVIDNEIYDDYHCKWIDSENKQEIVQYFEKDYDFVFLLGLAYFEKKRKNGCKTNETNRVFIKKAEPRFYNDFRIAFFF